MQKSKSPSVAEALIALVEAQQRTEQRMVEAQQRTEQRIERIDQRMERVEEILEALASAQQHTEAHVGGLETALTGLAEAQGRTEERLGRLEETQQRTQEQIGQLTQAQQRTEEQVAKLVEVQRQTAGTVRDLALTSREFAQQVGKLSDIIGFGLEDIAHVVLPGYLERHLGITVLDDELKRRFVDTANGQLVEVDLYGKGQRNGETVEIICECKSRIRSSQVKDFARTVERLRSELPHTLLPVMFGYWIHPSAIEPAQKAGITVVASYQR